MKTLTGNWNIYLTLTESALISKRSKIFNNFISQNNNLIFIDYLINLILNSFY
jgi:hypothetical protein